MNPGKPLTALTKAELIELLDDYARNWLAHDGLWFQAVEKRFDLQTAMDCDREAWRDFTVIEARRICKRLGIPSGSGLSGLKQALQGRMYARLNQSDFVDKFASAFTYRMVTCRVQTARQRKGLENFPCKPIGLVEYSGFAQTIDPRIQTTCVHCPPDDMPGEYCCAWRFTLEEKPVT